MQQSSYTEICHTTQNRQSVLQQIDEILYFHSCSLLLLFSPLPKEFVAATIVTVHARQIAGNDALSD
ncbi:4-hydroxy-3-methylbut-2-enyl diphosphate reductase [Dirofilaria immitis]